LYLLQQKALEELKSQGATQHQQQLEHASGDRSQRRSSVASMEVPMDHYPVDDITKKTSCEMHVPMKNISMKVAVGYVLPSEPGQTWHGREIRAGYARAGVDAIERGYEPLDLDVA
jgi:hypothetical protein